MKKKRWRISLMVVVISGIIFLTFRIIQNKRIPYIAFTYNSTRENCLYMCTDGDIYASTSEESFSMQKEEMIQKIKQNDYSDILEYVGTTKAGKVRKMYRLFSKVVLDEGYYIDRIYYYEPASVEYGGTKGYWCGVYCGEDGNLRTSSIYHSNAEKYCTDKRAYKIVDWMYETLKDYMK